MKLKLKLTKKKVLIFTPLIVLLMALLITGITVARDIPAFNPAKLESEKTTFIYDSKGNVIASLHANENRVPVTLQEMSPFLKQSFIAVEDARFYDHHGLDLRAIIRASVVNLQSREATEGASTITQQLVKNSILTPERTMKRKIQEAYLAIQMERKYTKDEILEMYLNRIYFGHGAYGVETAAQVYFGKKASDLNLGESAMLAGIPRNPSRYSPHLNMEKAKERQAMVLDLMVEGKYISVTDADNAKREPLNLVPLKEEDVKFTDYVDSVIEEAESKGSLPDNKLYRGGYKIYTSLDTETQNKADQVYANSNYFPPGKPDQIVQSGMALLNPHTGEIKALAGGRGQKVPRGFNRAIDPVGQPGSTFKPIAVYGPALEQKVSPDTILIDKPINIGGYAPKNYDYSYRGPITMRQAVALSVNVYAVRMLDKIGVDTGYNFARSLGFKQLGINDKGLSLALGGTSEWVSPLQMASAYGAFDNNGILVEPHTITKITDFNGNIIYKANLQGTRVMSEQTAHVMTELLEGVVKNGTGTNARMQWPVAGKTGTTELPGDGFNGLRRNKDTWFVGYTPELVGAVWVGYDRSDSQHYLSSYGGNFPASIWKEVMYKAHEGLPITDFDRNYNLNGFKFKFSETMTQEDNKVVAPTLPAENQTTAPVLDQG